MFSTCVSGAGCNHDDTSALSNLAVVEHLWLLEAIYQTVIIPDVVASELAAASNPAIPAILKLSWVQTRPLSQSQLANQLQQDRGLDAEEGEQVRSRWRLSYKPMIYSSMKDWTTRSCSIRDINHRHLRRSAHC